MSDLEPQGIPTDTFGRRDMLKRGAFVVGAVTVWSTPVVQTLGMRAAFATTGSPPTFVCVGPDGKLAGTLTAAVFKYTGEGPVDVMIEVKTGNSVKGTLHFCGVVSGQELAVRGSDINRTGINSDTYITIGSDTWTIHTSCSQAFFITQPVGPHFVVSGALDSNGGAAGTDPNSATIGSPDPCTYPTVVEEVEPEVQQTDIDEGDRVGEGDPVVGGDPVGEGDPVVGGDPVGEGDPVVEGGSLTEDGIGGS